MASYRAQKAAKLLSTAIIFSCFFAMGMQFTEHHFLPKQSLLPPVIILATVLIYHLLFDRQIIRNKNNIIVSLSLLIFSAYYVLNINDSIPLKMKYITYYLIIVLLFAAIVFFKNRLVDKKYWIVFAFLYSNLLFLPMLLSITNFNAENTNGIIAFALLFFCLINLKEKNIFFKIINIYTTVLLIVTLFSATSRTAMMAFLIAAIVFFTIKYLHKYIFHITASLVVLSPLVTGIYIYLKHTSLGTVLNKLSLDITGKNFFSGRDTLWNDAMDAVFQNESLWTGLGNNAEFGLYGGYLHNFYVQVFYQSGILGFVLVGVFLLAVTYAISKTTVIDFDFRILFGYFIAILFLQVFEGHMIYKFEIISVLFWIILAFLIRKSIQKGIVNNQAIE